MSGSAAQPSQMRLGDVLIMRGLLTSRQLGAALDRQSSMGGRLADNVVALGLLSGEQIAAVLDDIPATPLNLEQTGINRGSLLALMLKFLRTGSCETLPELSARMKLPTPVLQELIEDATAQRLIQVLGSTGIGLVRYMRYALTDQGRIAATDALAQSQYLGPAPVSLESYQAQVKKQALGKERVQEKTMREGFAGLVVPDNYIRKLLPAVRAGRTLLLYGPPGNGKTSIGTRLAKLYRNIVSIPYALEVNGQIIKIYDSRLHLPPIEEGGAPYQSGGAGVQLETFDARWVACRRPVVMAGGELTLEMLDLQFDPIAKFYDAPLHMKALNGLFLIDDFGRQKVNPTELLNRWIVPLESRIDYLTLNSGVSFLIPFDEMVVFSTNLQPADLMDPAFLRRIPYKIELIGPSEAEFRQIFINAAKARGLAVPEPVLDYMIGRLKKSGYELAYFQAHFLCEQVMQLCDCFDLPRDFTKALADEAFENLYVDMKL